MAQGQVVDRLIVEMVGDETRLRAGLMAGQRDVDKAVVGMETSLGRLNPRLAQLGAQFRGLMAGIATPMGAATVGIGALGIAAFTLERRGIPQVKELNTAFRVLVATGTDLTQAQLSQELDRIARSAGTAGAQFSRAQLATSLSELVKAGIDLNAALKLLPAGLQLATITGQSLNDTTSGLLGNLRQFGLTAEDASRAGDQLAKADLAAAHGVSELSDGLATIGPIAHTAGFSFSETLAALVELDNKGLNPASDGATGLRGVLASLLKPTSQARDTITGLGVSLENADGSARPVRDVLYELRDALKGNADAAAIAATIFQRRSLSAFLDLSNASKDLAVNIQDSNGALKGYSDTLLANNLTAAQNQFKTALDNFSETLAVKTSPALTDATNAAAGFLAAMDSLLNFDFPGLTTKLHDFAVNAAKAMGESGLFGYYPGGLDKLVPSLPGGGGSAGGGGGGTGGASGGRGANPAGGGGSGLGLTNDAAQLIAQVTPLVRAALTASKGTNAQAILQTNQALANWEGGFGNATPEQQAMRTAIVGYVRTSVNNAMKGAASDLQAPTPSPAVKLAAPGATANVNTRYALGINPVATSGGAVALNGGDIATVAILPNPSAALQQAQRTAQAINLAWRSAMGAGLLQGGRSAGGAVFQPIPGAGISTGLAMSGAASFLQGGPVDQQAVERARQAADYQREAWLRGLLSLPGEALKAGEKLAESALQGIKDGVGSLEARKAISDATASAMQAGLLQGGARAAIASTGPVAPGTYINAYQAAMQGGMLQGGFSGSPYAAGTAYATNRANAGGGSFTDSLNALEGAGREIYASQRKASLEQQKSAQAFAMTVVQAGGSFAQAIISGSPGGIVSSGLGAAGSIIGAIPDLAGGPLAGTIVSTVGSILGGLIGSGGSQILSENSAQAAAMRANAVPPALELKFTVNQNYSFDAFNDPATQAQMRGRDNQMFKQFQEVLAKTIVPRLNRLDRAVGLSS